MPDLHPDVILLVAGHLDLQTLSSLSQTSSFTNDLINTYEHSIVKAMVDRRIAAGLVFPPCGTIFTSATQDREFLHPFSYFVIQELDMRSRRVEALFSPSSPLVTAIHGSQSHVALPDRELDNLIAGLKRAVMLADRLSDCAAEALLQWAEPGEPLPQWPEQLSQIDMYTYYDEIKRTVKLAQFEVLHSCSPTDLAFLSTLADMAGMAYARENSIVEHSPEPWRYVTAFKETVFIHGSMALWACLRPRHNPAAPAPGGSGSDKTDPAQYVSGSSDMHIGGTRLIVVVKRTVIEVMTEMRLWEDGKGAYEDEQFADKRLVLPGIYLRIRTEYSQKTGRPFERVGVDMDVAVLQAIRQLGNDFESLLLGTEGVAEEGGSG